MNPWRSCVSFISIQTKAARTICTNSSSVLLRINPTLPWFLCADVIVIVNLCVTVVFVWKSEGGGGWTCSPAALRCPAEHCYPSKSTRADNKWQHHQASAKSPRCARAFCCNLSKAAAPTVKRFSSLSDEGWGLKEEEQACKNTATFPDLSEQRH